MRKQTKIAAMVSAAALLTIGAAMTSFAVGWSLDGDEWVYLDRYGEKVVNEWKKSGDKWFYLGDDGYMVTSQLLTDTGSDNEIYYVNSGGEKVTNRWVSVDNEDGFVLPSGDEPSTVYYYFDNAGKAIKATNGDYKAKKVKKNNDTTDQAYFLFDDQGHMMSGWVHNGGNTGSEDLYYLGSEDEGWARTGWNYLEDEEDVELDPYEDNHWYWFSDTGKSVAADTTKYINGYYYHFGDARYMDSDWFGSTASEATPGAVPDLARGSSDGRLKTGWIKRTEKDSDDEYWYYLINERSNGKVVATVPFNRNGAGTDGSKSFAARSINNKIYLFNYWGQMQTGVTSDIEGFDGAYVYNSNGNVMQDPNKAGTQYYLSENNVYYFNNVDGSSQGQMAKNSRVTVNIDGETYYYHFDKSGAAYRDSIVSGVLYDGTGKRVQSDAGWMAYELPAKGVWYQKGSDWYKVTGVVAVNGSGRVRTSTSTVRIDGETYTVTWNDKKAEKWVKDENEAPVAIESSVK